MKYKLYILLTFILATVGYASSIQQLGIDEGLSHAWAKAITKDKQGNIWVGTFDGLNRYNGTSVRVFRNQRNDNSTLSDNFIQALVTDRLGRIWAGTISGGLNRYDPKTDEFVSYRTSPKLVKTINSDNVTALFVDSQDRLWIGTDRGLCFYKEESDTFERSSFLFDSNVISGTVRDIDEDHLNRLLVGTDDGLFIAQLENQKFELINSDSDGTPKNGTVSLVLI